MLTIINRTDINSIFISSVNITDGPSATLALRPSSKFRNVHEALVANLETTRSTVEKLATTHKVAGVQETIRNSMRSAFGPVAKLTINEGRAALADLDGRWKQNLTAHKIDPARSLAIAARLSTVKAGELARLALSDRDIAVAALENRAIAGLPDSLVGPIQRYLVERSLASTIAEQHRTPPKFEKPFEVTDPENGIRYAETTLKKWDEERAEVEQLGNTVRNLTGWLSVATGVRTEQVWAELVEGML